MAVLQPLLGCLPNFIATPSNSHPRCPFSTPSSCCSAPQHSKFRRIYAWPCSPPPTSLAPVTPILKKGENADPANYPPIAVSEPILRLYASILNARVILLTEDSHLRAPSQAGFRPALSTLHPLFALQPFIDESSRTHTPLYCCFLDLKSAYDSVHRPLLWEVLGRLGIHGRMLAAL
jgi:hypothetical protein